MFLHSGSRDFPGNPRKTVDSENVLLYDKSCQTKRVFVGIICARVAQWWSIALPRRGSRVRIPSRAFFKRCGNVDFTAFPLFVFPFRYGESAESVFTIASNIWIVNRVFKSCGAKYADKRAKFACIVENGRMFLYNFGNCMLLLNFIFILEGT